MNTFGNFLWKIFSVTMVFFFHIGSNCAVAATKEITNPQEDPKIKDYFISKSETDLPSSTLNICQSGYYLAKCGSYVLGTNWLKGMQKIVPASEGDPTTVKVVTPDYYSYNTTDADSVHMTNLRNFFGKNEYIEYTAKTTNTMGNTIYLPGKIATPAEYVQYRNQILSTFCTDDQGRLYGISCEKCPNNARVAKSTVKEDSYATQKILWDTWNVHTIADCYMREFSDNTGAYVYVPDAAIKEAKNGSVCYYSASVDGSSLNYR